MRICGVALLGRTIKKALFFKAFCVSGKLFFLIFYKAQNHYKSSSYTFIETLKTARFENDQKWLGTSNKNGEKHNDNNLRNFTDENDSYLNRWDLLE